MKGKMDKSGKAFGGLVALFEQTQTVMQGRAVRAVDRALVIRNWLFGWYIVEYEHGGDERKTLYGKALIDRLAQKLKNRNIKGMSPTNLRKFREFYQAYSDIQQALPVECATSDNESQKNQQARPADSFHMMARPEWLQTVAEALAKRFTLGWTHYVILLTVKSSETRRFYELEAAENGWGYRELERQINAALYERLVISRDKEEVKLLSTRGHIVEKPSDVIKESLYSRVHRP
jgi:hypothetical protein